jgi:RNA polymerase sigma-70 factor (ECF subfamily)
MFYNESLISEISKLNRFALKLTKNLNDAEDLAQATILRAIEKKALFEEGTNLWGWTSKIMYNLFINNYHRRSKFETPYDSEDSLMLAKTEATQELKVEYAQVQKAIKRLSNDHQKILFMVCIKGMPYGDVSKILKVPIGTVRSRLSRARKNLQLEINRVDNNFEANTNNAAERLAA